MTLPHHRRGRHRVPKLEPKHMEQHQLDSLHRLQAGGQMRVMISQDTFDETVKETMDDFDMTFEEAVEEAMDQVVLL